MLGNRESTSVYAEKTNPSPAMLNFQRALGYTGSGGSVCLLSVCISGTDLKTASHIYVELRFCTNVLKKHSLGTVRG